MARGLAADARLRRLQGESADDDVVIPTRHIGHGNAMRASSAYSATVRMSGLIASSRSVPERAGRCLIRMLPALQCFVKRRAVGMRDCGGW